jgi:hypothetical protein
MDVGRPIMLPHGLLEAGEIRRIVELRAPTGEDEAAVLELSRHATAAEVTTAVLERCVQCLDGRAPTIDTVRALTAGDREALMLHLRRISFGDRLACVLDCPLCESRMDVTLSVGELLSAPYRDVQERHDATIEIGGEPLRVSFRLPTGADQEAAAAEDDVEAAIRMVIDRCVDEVRAGDRPLEALPDEAIDALSATMARLDPQAETALHMRCPEGEHRFTAVLDAGATVIAELIASEDQLLREVQAIALRYHWSEREILGLDVKRRRRYLELLDGIDEPLGARA